MAAGIVKIPFFFADPQLFLARRHSRRATGASTVTSTPSAARWPSSVTTAFTWTQVLPWPQSVRRTAAGATQGRLPDACVSRASSRSKAFNDKICPRLTSYVQISKKQEPFNKRNYKYVAYEGATLYVLYDYSFVQWMSMWVPCLNYFNNNIVLLTLSSFHSFT